MPIIEKIFVEDGLVGRYKMTEAIDEIEMAYIDIFQKQVPSFEFQHDRRKKEWLSVRLLIADLIGTFFTISYSDQGRPQILHAEYKYISISHSAGYAAVYLHKYKEVGIDIESLDRKFSFIEKKYLSEKELKQAEAHSLLRAIYWSCKEAIFKWAGREGVDFRKQIQIEQFDPENTNSISAVFEAQTLQQVSMKYLLFDGHVMVYTL